MMVGIVDASYSVKIHELNELKDVYTIIGVDESYGKGVQFVDDM